MKTPVVGPGGGPTLGPLGIPGAAAGGLFSQPTFRVIAEREPEIVGSPNVIVDALTQALKNAGAGGAASAGASGNTYLTITRDVFNAAIRSGAPVMVQTLNDNERGTRTQLLHRGRTLGAL